MGGVGATNKPSLGNDVDWHQCLILLAYSFFILTWDIVCCHDVYIVAMTCSGSLGIEKKFSKYTHHF